MKQLKQSTIKQYNVYKICKHLDKYQGYHVFPRLFIFNFQLDYIDKVEDFSNHFQYYCNIKEYDRELILDALNNIYKHSNK